MRRLFLDLRILLSDRSLPLVALWLSLAVAYALVSGAEYRAELTRSAREASDRDAAQMRDLTERSRELTAHPREWPRHLAYLNPHHAGAVGRYQVLRYEIMPPQPALALSVGQSDLFPTIFRVSTETRQTVLASRGLQNPRRLQEGHFDLVFVLIFVVPLAVIALSYNVLSADRESGVLRLVLSQPVRGFLLWRIGLRVLLLLAFIAALWLATALVGAPMGPGFALVTLLYESFWLVLACWLNTHARGSAANAAILVTVWLTLVILVPVGLNQVLASLYPLPSRATFLDATRQATLEANLKRSQLMSSYFEDHPELGQANNDPDDFYRRRAVLDQEVEKRLEPLQALHDQRLEQQQRGQDFWQILSPALLARNALEELSGTGSSRYADYVAQVESYQESYRRFFADRLFSGKPFLDPESIPAFHYRVPAPELPVRALAILTVLNLLFLLLLRGRSSRRARSADSQLGGRSAQADPRLE